LTHYSYVGDTLIDEEGSITTSSTARHQGDAEKRKSESDDPTVRRTGKTGNKKKRNSKDWSKNSEGANNRRKKNSMSISHSSLSVNSEDNIHTKRRSCDDPDETLEGFRKFSKIGKTAFLEDENSTVGKYGLEVGSLSRQMTSDLMKSPADSFLKLKMDSGKLNKGQAEGSSLTRQRSSLTLRKAHTESSSSSSSSEEENIHRKRAKEKRKNRTTKPKTDGPSLKRELSGSGDGNYQIDRSEIRIDGKVQEGAFGEVFKGVWLGNDVAIKKFRKRNKNITKQNLEAEVEILKNLRHPNILLYMGVCISDSDYLMITEFMENGSLFDHLHHKNTKIGPSLFVDIIEDIVLGMFYLHGRKVLHCDLKSANILVGNIFILVTKFRFELEY
jgi:hypothetical protein